MAAEGGEQQEEEEEQSDGEEPEIDEDIRRTREESEKAELQEKWHRQTVSEHLVYVKGSELVFFEFKEIVLELAVRFRDQVDPTTGKLKVVLQKFIEEWMLRRLESFVKFNIPTSKQKADAARQWPESWRDKVIKKELEEKEREQKLESKRAAERELQNRELARMAEEDTPALDAKEVAELRRKMIEEEEAARRAREALEENQLDDEEESESEDD